LESGESAKEDAKVPKHDDPHDGMSPTRTRRKFLEQATLTAGLAALPRSFAARPLISSASDSAGCNSPQFESKRANEAYELRVRAALQECDSSHVNHFTNGDEERYPNKIASFTKALPHNPLGEVDSTAYQSLNNALVTGDPKDYENIILGGDQRLTCPQAGAAFDLRGPDSNVTEIKPAPAFSSAEEAAEIAENYWMALTRDVPFAAYDSDPVISRAAEDLSRFSDFHGPRIAGKITPQCIFRGNAPGTLAGPYLSQFLIMDARYGLERLERKIHTAMPGMDYMTSYDDWLSIQNGKYSWPDQYDPTFRYIRNGRDLGQSVHYDVGFQAYFDALLVLFQLGAARAPHDPYVYSRTQRGFVTFGVPHIAAMLGVVCLPALKACWFQKWFVHRRLRPEAFGGRIHNHMDGRAEYPIHPEILSSEALQMVFAKNKTYLLPQAFPEGAPTHPAYSAGHATKSGACATILKAFFDESFVIRRPLMASPDGLSTVVYEGPELTVGGELNKLAYNIAIGRNMAGIHWRSDADESIKLGERTAIYSLTEERNCLREAFDGFSFTKFDGTKITI
jgi:hypothetical protein